MNSGLKHFFLSVQDGQILTSYNLGSGPTSTVAPDHITDGLEHTINIEIKHVDVPTSKWECVIKIDAPENGINNVDDHDAMEINGEPIFLGGLITESSLNLGDKQLNLTSFTSLMNQLNGFNGCIHNLKIRNHEINFESDAAIIFNAKPCRSK